jgi:hypothetical protein
MRGRKAQSSLQAGGNTIKQSLAMKSTLKRDRFPGGGAAPEVSRFETIEPGPFFETSACAEFGRKLQKIFPLPPESSEPEDVRVLLKKIQAKLNTFPFPGNR